ncbi:MAG TPA: LiaF domain-containing protein [Puia sp.]|nr:LiaF domain-containing protein [Puia sp.]
MDERNINPRRPGRTWAGLFLVGVGAVLVLDQMGFPLPDWLFNWHAFLIALGLFVGFRHGFRGGLWLILILVGVAFQFQDYYPQIDLHRYIFPGIVILVGIIFILNPNHGRYHWKDDFRMRDKAWKQEWKQKWGNDWKHEWRRHRYGWRTGADATIPVSPNPAADPNAPGGTATGAGGPASAAGPAGTGVPGGAGPNADAASGDQNAGTTGSTGSTGNPYTGPTGRFNSGYASEDYIDTTTFFGGIHKKIVSKNFKGGDVVTIMGGTELDLTQADFTGTVKLDVVQIFGATKIIVPSSWEVRSEVTAIFAGFEDKRQQPASHNPDKVLLIDGTSLMGGIELRNY